MPPGEQQRDALGRDQALALQRGEDLVLEEALRDVRVHEGGGHEAIVARPASLGCKGVDVGVWIDAIAELWITATMPGRRSGSSTAAAINSRTVSQVEAGEVPAWWTDADAIRFDQRARSVVDRFSLEYAPGNPSGRNPSGL